MEIRCDNPFLPIDIIINILKRLPVKSIVRFQCVLKEWKDLLESPSFIAEHARHSAHERPLLLLHEYSFKRGCLSISLLNHKMETVEVLSIPSIDPFRCNWRIIGSCNGLLCVKVHRDQAWPRSFLWLWNPVIKKVREIPLTTNDPMGRCEYGFGFCGIVNDYKIVKFYKQKIRKKKKDQHFHLIKYDRVEVYSLSTGSWKELEFQLRAIEHAEILSQAVNTDGTISWLLLSIRNISPIIVSFDIATEVFRFTQITLDYGSFLGLDLYINKQNVHYVTEENSGSRFIGVWVAEEVASESRKSLRCTQKYRIGPRSGGLRPTCIWGSEIIFRDTKFKTQMEDPRCILYLFNLITNAWRTFNCSADCDWCDVFNYEESLVSLSV
ncbi:hypothetical protein QN277_005689 [Acacia crassicarpa]|uniref:F-box domain-containing protein n=1 Tax=Acacia crassicarpa TaxID=499986 RepID=A0AAE1IWU1_9FABA|nr:hypothetical protein QN277_005689 [Acacia crassicarpa]